jgi:peroxiredoxin Q/BCP
MAAKVSWTLKAGLLALLACLAWFSFSDRGSKATPSPLEPGDIAPDFESVDQNGQKVHLQDFRKQHQAVVLYFYPKDNTPGCTREACQFRDAYDVFREAGAVVIGVSGDSTASHQRFSTRYQLPFHLVSDADQSLRRRYRVPSTANLLPGRVTFVIDREGIIRHVFNSQFNPEAHIQEALQVVRQLQREGTPTHD